MNGVKRMVHCHVPERSDWYMAVKGDIRWHQGKNPMPWFHVYVLQSLKDQKFYIGISQNLDNRARRHNAGQTISTANRRPFKPIFYESFLTKKDAQRRERYFKTAKGKTTLKQMLREYLKTDTHHNVPG